MVRHFIDINLCLKYMIKNLAGLISEFLLMNNLFSFQRNIPCFYKAKTISFLLSSLRFKNGFNWKTKIHLFLIKLDYASWYLIICVNNSLRFKGLMFSYPLKQYILPFIAMIIFASRTLWKCTSVGKRQANFQSY